MNKRNPQNKGKIFDLENEVSPHSERLLHTIQQKLDHSAALNGGFDKLLFKIDVIENNQTQMSEKVDKIHDAIYHPDDGLFARISKNKADQLESMSKIEMHVSDISSKQNSQEKSAQAFEKSQEELKGRIHNVEHTLEVSKQSRAYIFSVLKWLGPAGIGGIVTLLISFIFEHLKK